MGSSTTDYWSRILSCLFLKGNSPKVTINSLCLRSQKFCNVCLDSGFQTVRSIIRIVRIIRTRPGSWVRAENTEDIAESSRLISNFQVFCYFEQRRPTLIDAVSGLSLCLRFAQRTCLFRFEVKILSSQNLPYISKYYWKCVSTNSLIKSLAFPCIANQLDELRSLNLCRFLLESGLMIIVTIRKPKTVLTLPLAVGAVFNAEQCRLCTDLVVGSTKNSLAKSRTFEPLSNFLWRLVHG